MLRFLSATLSGLKYLLAVVMMVSGINTAFFDKPLSADATELDFIYSSKTSFFLFGLWFFLSGLGLLVGKIMKWKYVIGHSLMSIYLAFIFVGCLNWYTFGIGDAWLTLLLGGIIGALYLRWKYQILYVPKPKYRDFRVDRRRPVV